MSQDREDFERFWDWRARQNSRGAEKRAQQFERLADGTYREPTVQRHWWTWQCARNGLPAAYVDRRGSWDDAEPAVVSSATLLLEEKA